MANIFAVINLILTIVKFVKWAKDAWGEMKFKQWVSDLETTVKGMIDAKTPEQKTETAKRMVDIIGRLNS